MGSQHLGCASSIALTALILAAPAAVACPAAPPAMKNLDIPRFYGDAKGSVIDPEQKARHDAAVTPLTEFVRAVTSHADKAHTRTKPAEAEAAATCALAWITAWAADDAWLGRMAQAQAEYQRKWDLAGVALAYLKVRPRATADQRRTIEPWLIRFADAALGFFDDRRHKRNNHWYWLGLALGATALATDSERHWVTARGIMADAARDIGADGTLPLELARGSRALLYHTFAAMPLVTLAELAAGHGEDWYGLGDGALHRLVAVTTNGMADPAGFANRTGVAQEPAPWSSAVWLHAYAARFPERARSVPLAEVKRGHRWIGGDGMVLNQVLATIKAGTRGTAVR